MPTATLQVRALLTLRRAEEACTVAEQVLATLPILGGAGVFEVEFRLVASEAFHAASNRPRAHTELLETLRQIRIRANDVTDPICKDSYLTRNPDCTRAYQLAKEWHLGE